MSYLQDFKEDATVRFSFTTNDGSGGRVAPSSAFAASDLRIFKNGSATQKTSTNGITMTSPFDSMVGVHHVDIDTSNDTDDAGFWVANADYEVVLYPSKTVDGESVSAVVAEFSIENRYTSNSDEDLGVIKTLVDAITGKIGTPVALDGGAATLGSMLTKMADDNDGADYDATTDSLDAAGFLAGSTNFAAWANNAIVDLIVTDTNELQGDDVPGLIAALENLVDRNFDVIESQRGMHTAQRGVFYVDPVNGGTHAAGNRGGRDDPYDTVQECHDNAVTDSNHDLIILIAGHASAVTTLTENVTLSKRYLFIRGPGRDFIWTRSGNGDTITITADGVELSGFQLETAGTGSGNGIQLTDADFLRVHHVWINDTQGDGIGILRGSNCQITDNSFFQTGQGGSGQGIDISGTAGSSNNNNIFRNHFRDCAGDGIQISGGITNNTTIAANFIEGSTGWGLDIKSSSVDTIIHNNWFGNNTNGDINDEGITTIRINNEQWATTQAVVDATQIGQREDSPKC